MKQSNIFDQAIEAKNLKVKSHQYIETSTRAIATSETILFCLVATLITFIIITF